MKQRKNDGTNRGYTFDVFSFHQIDWSDDVFTLSLTKFHQYFKIVNVTEVNRPDYLQFQTPYPECRKLFETSDLFALGTFQPFFARIPISVALWRKVRRFKHRFRLHNRISTLCLNADAIESKISEGQNDLIGVVSELPLKEPELFRHIQLNAKEIEKLAKKYKVNSQVFDVAIHVRDTDKTSPQRESLHKIIDELASQGKPQKIYLATDNKIVINELTEKYGESFDFTFLDFERNGAPLHLNRNDAEKKIVFESAIIDLYHLASAKTILFQENSSFSRVAIALSSPNSIRIAWSTV